MAKQKYAVRGLPKKQGKVFFVCCAWAYKCVCFLALMCVLLSAAVAGFVVLCVLALVCVLPLCLLVLWVSCWWSTCSAAAAGFVGLCVCWFCVFFVLVGCVFVVFVCLLALVCVLLLVLWGLLCLLCVVVFCVFAGFGLLVSGCGSFFVGICWFCGFVVFVNCVFVVFVGLWVCWLWFGCSAFVYIAEPRDLWVMSPAR